MNGRYSSKAWNQLFLPRLSGKRIADLVKKKPLLVLPVGAVEQHGPHLPVYTDTLIAEGALSAAFEHLSEEDGIWLLPPLAYGKSTEHEGWSGTISLSAATLLSVIMDIALSLHRQQFDRLVLFNSHGGNVDLLNMAARDIRAATGMMVFRLDAGSLHAGAELLDERERFVGIHGGDSETSQVMRLQPHWVEKDAIPQELPALDPSSLLHFKNKRFAWLMSDISESGICGNAELATAEKGGQIIEEAAREIAELLIAMKHFDFDTIRTGVRSEAKC